MHRLTKFIFSLFCATVCAPSILFGQTLAWDPNPEPDIAGYRVYRGTTSGTYPVMVDVGKVTTYAPQGVDWSIRQYFVVKAYNTSALESPSSNEAVWTPPSVTTFTSLTSNPSGSLVVGAPATWTAVASNNLGPVEYRFYLNRMNTWSMMRDYQTTNTWTWTPQSADVGSPYYVQVWARRVGSTVSYEAYRGTSAFAVVPPPLQLTSNVDFPTPADNVVTWTATPATTPTTPLEYQFRVMNTATSTWTVFRSYAQNNEAQWVPGANGTYVVEAWSRPVGSSATFQHSATSNPLTVQSSALTVPALFVDTTFPAAAGKPVTFKARAQGGSSGPLQYSFYLYSATGGWKNVQPYGPSPSFMWTPTFGDEGTRHLQVWARPNASTGTYEAWRASGAFVVNPASLHLSANRLFPAPPGSAVRWTASVSDPTATLEYQFWVYSAATGQWTIAQPYGLSKTFDWVAGAAGSYGVRVWSRQIGSSAQFDATAETNAFQIANGGGQLVSLVSNRALPVNAGTAVTWTAAARGGSAALQYQFWRDDGTGWVMVQDYSSSSTYSWTPLASNAGPHNLQVRVRSAGATAYESYMTFGTFSVLP